MGIIPWQRIPSRQAEKHFPLDFLRNLAHIFNDFPTSTLTLYLRENR